MPDEVLKAHTIKVVILIDVREKLPNPKSEQAIRDAVEGALAKWGRFNLVEGKADLVIVAREGHVEAPKPSVPPTNPKDPLAPNSGNPPLDANTPGLRSRVDVQRTINEIRAEEDSLEIYQGNVIGPLNAAPIWQYRAKGCLKGSKLAAVEHFRKAIEESERLSSQKH